MIHVHRLERSGWERLRQLRLAALADAPDAFGTTLAEAETLAPAAWQDNAGSTLVGVLDGRDAGLLAVRATEVDGVIGLYGVWVAPWARGRGVGDALLREGLEVARRAGARRVVLDVGVNNTPARVLYERHGFTPTGRLGHLPAPREHVRELELGRDLADEP